MVKREYDVIKDNKIIIKVVMGQNIVDVEYDFLTRQSTVLPEVKTGKVEDKQVDN